MKQHNKTSKGAVFILGVLCLAFMAPVFAAKDVIYPSAAIAQVNAIPQTGSNISNSFSSGSDGNTTLNADVVVGQAVVVSGTWSIKNNNTGGSGANTDYTSGRTVNFTSSTTVTPLGGSAITVSLTGTPCTVTSAASTCSTGISFAAPNTVGGYQVKITSADSCTGGSCASTRLDAKVLFINFTVVEEPAVELKDTTLTVDPKCVLYKAGNVDLTATLEELAGGAKIPGADIDFFIDPPSATIGTALTDTVGVATLSYNIDGLTAGDHNLYAEFLGDAVFNASNDSATLGISYVFVGFQQPINGDGTSIFGGRVIPIKIMLLDANGNPVTNAQPKVYLTSYDKDLGVGTDLEPASSVSAADTDNIMRYAVDDHKYIYNWDASGLPNGTYAVVVVLGDSSTCRSENPYAIITVAKKGKK